MSKIHAELNNQSLNGTSSQEITRTTVGTKNGLHIYDISAKAPTAFGENISEGKQVKISAAATYSSGGRPLDSFTVAPGQSEKVNLEDIVVPPTLRLVVTAKKEAGGSAADVTTSINWLEDL